MKLFSIFDKALPTVPPSFSDVCPSSVVAPSRSHTPTPLIISYNINSLSYYSTNSIAVTRRNSIYNCLRDFIKKSDIICLQETNLALLEQQALTNFSRCIISRNNFDINVAGTVIIDTPDLLLNFTGVDLRLPSICQGYVQARRYTPTNARSTGFQIVNCYLKSGGVFSLNKDLITPLNSLPNDVPTFLCGDLNFIERLSDSTSGNPTLPPADFLTAWDKVQKHLDISELFHDAHTYFHITSDPLSPHSVSSRLDRFFIPCSLIAHPIIFPAVQIMHHPTNYSVSTTSSIKCFSDHLPIQILYSHDNELDNQKKSRTIPRWIAESCYFSQAFRHLWVSKVSHPPFVTLSRFKKCMFDAAKIVKNIKISSASASLNLSQHLSLVRLIEKIPQDLSRIYSLFQINPALSNLVTWTEDHWAPCGLFEAVNDLRNTPPSTTPAAPNYLKFLSDNLPCTKSRLVALQDDVGGIPAVSAADKSKVAAAFWSKIWKARDVCVTRSQRGKFLAAYNKKVNPALCSEPDLEAVCAAIKRSNNSSAGPDGICFAAWRSVAELAAPVLLSALKAILKGHTPPVGFNFGLLFLLPKKLTGLISDTRPLSVTNTDNRLLASVVAHAIMPAVADLINPCQKGFVTGRCGSDHVVDINSFFYDAIRKKAEKLLFLLDTAKAFDSVDHDWISHVLAKASFPRWLINFVSGSLSSVRVAPFFGGPLCDWIPIERGVKQGCPLSPILFIIAYDPLLTHLSRLNGLTPFAFADDLAITASEIKQILPALDIITTFSSLSGLGINKKKSMVISTAPTRKWSLLKEELKLSSWPDLPLMDSGVHLGIPIGRDITLDDVWRGPWEKARERLKHCKPFVSTLSLSSRLLFINVFIVSIFSYISLFFILPGDLWKEIRAFISKTVIPFNGGAYTYTSLVCAKSLYSIKNALKDVWAFNISLLAVRSPFFTSTLNYKDLPYVNISFNMHIVDHRDAAAVDYWRGRHQPDGRLIPVSPPTSSAAYKSIIADVFLTEAATELNKKITGFLSSVYPLIPFSDPLTIITSNLSKISFIPQFIIFFHVALINNALPTSRRMRHMNNVSVLNVHVCFFCGVEQDSLAHIFSICGVLNEARSLFLHSHNCTILSSSVPFPLHISFLCIPDFNYSTLIVCFNLAIWNFRRQALASSVVRPRSWLINRVVELAQGLLGACKPSVRKKLAPAVISEEIASHNCVISNSDLDTVFCYTDGSASPNPGPCGAGATCFVPSIKTVYDLGQSLGHNSNNFGELYALGMLFLFLIRLCADHPGINNVFIFSDSKLAINAAISRNKPISNCSIILALRRLFCKLSACASVKLLWIRGHTAIGGNERVDLISKAFARSPVNIDPFSFSGSFPSVCRSFFWDLFPLAGLPVSCFQSSYLRPQSSALVGGFQSLGVYCDQDFVHLDNPPSIYDGMDYKHGD